MEERIGSKPQKALQLGFSDRAIYLENVETVFRGALRSGTPVERFPGTGMIPEGAVVATEELLKHYCSLGPSVGFYVEAARSLDQNEANVAQRELFRSESHPIVLMDLFINGPSIVIGNNGQEPALKTVRAVATESGEYRIKIEDVDWKQPGSLVRIAYVTEGAAPSSVALVTAAVPVSAFALMRLREAFDRVVRVPMQYPIGYANDVDSLWQSLRRVFGGDDDGRMELQESVREIQALFDNIRKPKEE